MEIIIDAYNLLKQLSSGTIGEHERRRFITTMKSYSIKKHHKVTIVFDGGSFKRPFWEDFDDVRVVYSGFELSADDYIKQCMPALHANNALIVTADRAICMVADRYDIVSINPSDFMRFVHKAVDTSMHVAIHGDDKARPLRAQTQKTESLDALMEQASAVVIDKDRMLEDNDAHVKRTIQKRLSKTERKLETIVKKL